MKRCVLFALFLILPSGVFAQTATRYIVVTRQPAREALGSIRKDDSWEPRAASGVREFRYINAFAADLTADDVAVLKASSDVRWIEPVVERHILTDTVTPGQQTTPYGVTMVHAPDVWPVTRGKAIDGKTSINVAEIDTGIRYTDTELKPAYRGGFNFTANNADPLDDNGHGTHVAGTIAAADDGVGVVGVAPQVNLWGLKVLDACGSGSTENVMQAVEWVITQKSSTGGDWIMTLSLGSDTPSDAEKAEFQRAQDNGILTFAAAGNNYDSTMPDALSYPAGYPSVVSVGAVDSTGTLADFSQRGAQLGVVAPGVSVLSTFIGGHVATDGGANYIGALPEAEDASMNPVCLNAPNIPATSFVFCNFGASATDFPSSVKGKIALIQRGPISNGVTFLVKLENAKTAGAIGAVLFDHTDEMPFSPGLTLASASKVSTIVPAIFLTKADGSALQATPNATVAIATSPQDNLYALLDGTSMATPHASAVAALVWAVAPSAPASAVANAIESTATPGADSTYGHGLVNAINAAKSINASAFGIGVAPSPVPVPGRRPGRRGH